MKLGELEFKAEDFLDEENRKAVQFMGDVFSFDAVKECEKLAAKSALIANRILKEKLEKASEMCSPNGRAFVNAESALISTMGATHTARLVCIEEIGK